MGMATVTVTVMEVMKLEQLDCFLDMHQLDLS
jgi:hypothetical protein